MTYQTLRTRRDGRILYVDFDNPPVNLMTIEMVTELFDLAGSLMFDPTTAAVVFGSANPDFFIAHFDLNDLLRVLSDPSVPQSRYDDINVVQALTATWQGLPQVTIGVVDGICRGAGLEFLLAPDLPGGGGTTRLAMQIGPARAREVILSARDFTGTEAAAYGIVNRALPREELPAYVEALAGSVATRSIGTIAAVADVIKNVFGSFADAQFAGFASENTALRSLLGAHDVTEALRGLAGAQDIEHELDLPETIAAGLPR
jgi:enoyl-CoA hydratase/carnithine racemase